MKAFCIRVLQVIWIGSILIIAFNLATTLATHSEGLWEILGLSLSCLVFLVVVQYLIFAKIHPSWLFGESKGRYFTLFVIFSFVTAIIGGIVLKLYNSYEYDKKLEAGSDVVFFDSLLKNTLRKHDLAECNDIDQIPSADKKELQAAALKLSEQKVNGLNILVKIAEREDALGRRFRCLVNEDIDVEEIAQIANVKY